MILPLKTNAYAEEMRSLLALACALMTYLAADPDPPLDDAALAATAPAVRRLVLPLRAEIEQLIRESTPEERELLARAFENDCRFDVNVDSRQFCLQYPSLPLRLRQSAARLLSKLYKVFAEKGFSLTRADGTTIVVNRALLEQGFFERNPIRACPACLEQPLVAAPANGSTSIDCDHFLPKSLYGPLTIHPQNLVFTCMPCNLRRKGRSDPLTGPCAANLQVQRRTRAGALRTTYLPYRRPALPEMKIKFAPGGVSLTAETDIGRERVRNLDRLFELENVWSDVLPRAEREMLAELGGPPTKKSVAAVLDDVVGRGRHAPDGLEHGVFLRSRYAAHLRDDRLDLLVGEWQRKSKELRSSADLYGHSQSAASSASAEA
jgi:hypothetical protein